jgi:hypothetical protein
MELITNDSARDEDCGSPKHRARYANTRRGNFRLSPLAHRLCANTRSSSHYDFSPFWATKLF